MGDAGSGSTGDPVEIVDGVQISNTQPSGYVWSILTEGGRVYIDRSFTYSNVPTGYQGLAVLRTANDDKRPGDSAFLKFNVT